MAAGNLCVCVLFALVAGNLILAEEQDKFSMMNPFDFFSSFFGDSSRMKRSPSPEEAAPSSANSSEHQNRLFFSLLSTRVVACNYSTENGTTCRSCQTALRCYPSNVGIQRTCRGFLPYCNNGRCSYIQGSACNSTSG